MNYKNILSGVVAASLCGASAFAEEIPGGIGASGHIYFRSFQDDSAYVGLPQKGLTLLDGSGAQAKGVRPSVFEK